MKKDKITTVFTFIIILLPTIVGLVLWNKLPDEVATHFDFSGNADGYSDKAFAVFGTPLVCAVLQLLCILGADEKVTRGKLHGTLRTIVLWICPAVSWLSAVSIYGEPLGFDFDRTWYTVVFMGVLFMILGNYMPKIQRNYTVGIKLPWTVADDDVWNRTHRLAGFIWVAGGAVIIVALLLPRVALAWVMGVDLAVMTFVPGVYSYVIFKKKNGK